MPEKILVIKLSALGDFILALGAMEAIRRHHPQAHITLLTTRPFVDLARQSPYFNDILIDSRPRFYQLGGWYALFRLLNSGGYTRVYDLQANDRTAIYYRLLLRKPEWSGALPGPLYCPEMKDKTLHAAERHRRALKMAGLDMALPDLSWLDADISAFGLQKPYVLLVPGSSPRHPQKRWPAVRYGALALKLMQHGYQVAVLGAAAERDTVARVLQAAPGAVDLSGRTSLNDIAALARQAAAAVGNDTGPMHLIAQAGCPATVLFCTRVSRPELSSPVGRAVQVIAAEDLDTLSVGEVWKTAQPGAAA